MALAFPLQVTPAKSSAADVDAPLLAMYRRHCELVIACEIHAQPCMIRVRLVDRYGEPAEGVTAESIWSHDPEYVALQRACRASDRLNEERFDLQEEIEETEAQTLDGMLAKIRVALYVTCPGEMEESEYDLLAARNVLIETERMLTALRGELLQAGE